MCTNVFYVEMVYTHLVFLVHSFVHIYVYVCIYIDNELTDNSGPTQTEEVDSRTAFMTAAVKSRPRNGNGDNKSTIITKGPVPLTVITQ